MRKLAAAILLLFFTPWISFVSYPAMAAITRYVSQAGGVCSRVESVCPGKTTVSAATFNTTTSCARDVIACRNHEFAGTSSESVTSEETADGSPRAFPNSNNNTHLIRIGGIQEGCCMADDTSFETQYVTRMYVWNNIFTYAGLARSPSNSFMGLAADDISAFFIWNYTEIGPGNVATSSGNIRTPIARPAGRSAWDAGAFQTGGGSSAASPVISPPSGSFSSPTVSVSMTCSSPSCVIFFTTDGTQPTHGSAQYSAPFSIPVPATVQAFSSATGLLDSVTTSAIYTRTALSATVVDWTNTHQTIDGFGASLGMGGSGNLSSGGSTLTAGEATTVFSHTSGAGLSLLRVAVWPDGTYPDDAAIDNVLAADPSVKIWGASWSPPASMKTTGSNLFSCTWLQPGQETNYANYFVNWIKHEQASGHPIYALSIQNEPDFVIQCNHTTAQPFGSPTGTQFRDFLKNNLGPALAAAGLSAVHVIIPETSNYNGMPTWADPCINDAGCLPFLSIAASHIYSGTIATYPNAQSHGLSLWETEISSFGTFNPSITDALDWAQNLHTFMATANANAWHWWIATTLGFCDNETLLSADVCPGGRDQQAKRLWAFGNYSKFVRPGFVRVDVPANPQSGVFATAYKNNATGILVVVLINTTGSDVSQAFSINNAPTFTSMVPWVTSSTLDLAQQTAITVSGNAFSYTLPAQSVTSLVGQSVSSPAALINPAGVTVANQSPGMQSHRLLR